MKHASVSFTPGTDNDFFYGMRVWADDDVGEGSWSRKMRSTLAKGEVVG